jgi:hypothetical protein
MDFRIVNDTHCFQIGAINKYHGVCFMSTLQTLPNNTDAIPLFHHELYFSPIAAP